MLTVYDTGLAPARSNQACDRLAAARAAAGAEPTLRFYRSLPAASLGRHQAAAREIRTDYCLARGIEIVRRPTGGGALYVDPEQLGFSLALGAAAPWSSLPLAAALAQGAAALAAALRALGVEARVKLPNDVEVAGRKLASVFAARAGRALLLQGIVVLRADVRTMLEALRLPTEKLSADGLAAARERLAGLAEYAPAAAPAALAEAIAHELARATGERLERGRGDVPPPPARALARERALARACDWRSTRGRIEVATRAAGGATLRVRARFGPASEALREIEFATDAHLAPAGFLRAIESALAGLAAQRAARAISRVAHELALDAVGIEAADFASAVREAAAKHRLARRHGFSLPQVNALFVHGRDGDPAALARRAEALLVPYCAKPAWCKWRFRDGCSECGRCEVGDVYRLARERGLEVRTITRYEHLVACLNELKARGVGAYVGMCCGSFYLKRHRAFTEAGVPALLMDVSGANCYELKQEEEAYAGRFLPQSRIDRALLARVARLIPARRGGWGAG